MRGRSAYWKLCVGIHRFRFHPHGSMLHQLIDTQLVSTRTRRYPAGRFRVLARTANFLIHYALTSLGSSAQSIASLRVN